MSRRYWLPIFALIGLVTLAGASHDPAEQNPGTQGAHVIQPPPAVPSDNYSPYPDRRSETCYQSNNHETADLCAQWRAAYAAENAVAVGIFSAVLSFLSLLAVAASLWQTRSALGISRREFESARREAEDASQMAASVRDSDREVGEAQVRAYIAPLGGRYEITAQGLKVWIAYKNFGQSPALRVDFRAEAIISVPLDPSFLNDRKIVKTVLATNSWGAVPVGGEDATFIFWSKKQIGESNFAALISGKSFHRVEGTLGWIDIFKKQQNLHVNLWLKGEEFARADGFGGTLEAHSSEDQQQDKS